MILKTSGSSERRLLMNSSSIIPRTYDFDITTRARYEQDVKEEWKDVSEEVAREIASIWESEYGGDWRRIIMARPACRPVRRRPSRPYPNGP